MQTIRSLVQLQRPKMLMRLIGLWTPRLHFLSQVYYFITNVLGSQTVARAHHIALTFFPIYTSHGHCIQASREVSVWERGLHQHILTKCHRNPGFQWLVLKDTRSQRGASGQRQSTDTGPCSMAEWNRPGVRGGGGGGRGLDNMLCMCTAGHPDWAWANSHRQL